MRNPPLFDFQQLWKFTKVELSKQPLVVDLTNEAFRTAHQQEMWNLACDGIEFVCRFSRNVVTSFRILGDSLTLSESSWMIWFIVWLLFCSTFFLMSMAVDYSYRVQFDEHNRLRRFWLYCSRWPIFVFRLLNFPFFVFSCGLDPDRWFDLLL